MDNEWEEKWACTAYHCVPGPTLYSGWQNNTNIKYSPSIVDVSYIFTLHNFSPDFATKLYENSLEIDQLYLISRSCNSSVLPNLFSTSRFNMKITPIATNAAQTNKPNILQMKLMVALIIIIVIKGKASKKAVKSVKN